MKNSTLTTAGLTLATSAAPTRSFGKVIGANDRVRVGFIGLGNRGSQLLQRFMKNSDVEVAALCDLYKPFTTRDRSQVDKRWLKSGKSPKMGETLPSSVKRFTDFRRMLEMNDLDAVCVATPDHWHAIITIQAIAAGKDVYVEKPLTVTIEEGRAMVNAQKQSKQVVAVGLNRRGSSVYQKLAKELRDGKIGRIVTARAYRISNMFPNGIGKMKPEKPPRDFDWNMWLGPRAKRPYQYNIAPYYFRWWKDYSSQMGNWGVHYMDAIRWMAGETAPVAITASGVSGIIKDDRTIPDNMEVTFEFKSGLMVQFHIYEACNSAGVEGGEVELNGTKGTVVASQSGYTVTPAHPGQFQKWKRQVESEEYSIEGTAHAKEDSTSNLIRNFLDCIKSRNQPLCCLEDGHRSTSFAHLANISLAMQQRIEWDPVAERVTNNDDANSLLHYEYRKPWRL
ncbi:MAG: Gfo/Idh/MocA family oxidoreductase [Candidatus Hydrogenedentes bacterium]|nr:Gfo/Idh/MocA family oxidoreductase [Candidatus Hydrogenedentota bacterium]